MTKSEDLQKGDYIKAELYSRPNVTNGRYNTLKLNIINELEHTKRTDIFFLETLQMKANFADKIIREKELLGENLNDPKVISELSEEINTIGTPIHKSESIMTAIFTSAQLIIFYGVISGVIGVIFGQNFLVACFVGIILGLLVSLLFIIPIISVQRTNEQVREKVFAIGALLIPLGIGIGVIGLIIGIVIHLLL